MRLKEIKPEMAVHCKNEKEKKMLLEEAERLGYVWYSTKRKPTERSTHSIGCTIHFCDKGTNSFSVDYKHITHSCQTGDSVIEFSDLIIPEMSAEEVISTLSEIRNCRAENRDCLGCPIEKYCTGYQGVVLSDKDEILEICQQWKAEREKKDPEIETVDVCRIIKIQTDGCKRCVHEEDIKPDPGLPYGYVRDSMNEILKHYCMEHDGEFIAVHEVVSRVKR